MTLEPGTHPEGAATPRPTLEGTVLAVCLGPGGLPKDPVDEAELRPLGLEGDRHRFKGHGGADRAVCLFALEDYRSLWADGVEAQAPGAFGENLLTEGLDYAQLRPGDRLEVGRGIVLEIHDIREPCGTLRKVDTRFPDLMIGRSGFVCRVVQGGTLRPGLTIRASQD